METRLKSRASRSTILTCSDSRMWWVGERSARASKYSPDVALSKTVYNYSHLKSRASRSTILTCSDSRMWWVGERSARASKYSPGVALSKTVYNYSHLKTAVCVRRSSLAKIVEVAIHVNECTWFTYGDLRQRTSLGSAIIVGGCRRSKFPAIFAGVSWRF